MARGPDGLFRIQPTSKRPNATIIGYIANYSLLLLRFAWYSHKKECMRLAKINRGGGTKGAMALELTKKVFLIL